jgi:ABC-type bacteriocin/lantibiotic exporter with double-glycine peptidase domain
MKSIKQKHKSDCFPTCIAMVSGISHRRALKLCHPRHKKRQPYYTSIPCAIGVLERLGFNIKTHKKPRFKKLADIKRLAIIEIRVGEDDSHVVVWDPQTKKIHDPDPAPPLRLQSYVDRMLQVFEVVR